MKFVYEKINVSHENSFITRRLNMDVKSDKVHSHKNFELNYISSGSGRRIVGNNISSYSKGDLVLLGPNISHCWEVLDPGAGLFGECIVTHLYESLSTSDFFNKPELKNVAGLFKEAEKGIVFKGQQVNKVAESLQKMIFLEGLDKYIELLKVFSILLKIDNREYLTLPDSFPDNNHPNRVQIDKVYEYVFHNIQNGVNLNDAAKLLFLEPSSFCRFFKKKTNQTFMEYVKSVRIGIAAKLLAETDKPISQICHECGYNNLANFNYYFKSIMEKTPSEYRKPFKE
jgi:AraC-like DNA-binding protein